ncbi:MAG: ribosomal-processing cysteine protease Prp [Eubacteriales bacterium]
MIRVVVRRDYVEVSGHANYVESGKDIICAAVSA